VYMTFVAVIMKARTGIASAAVERRLFVRSQLAHSKTLIVHEGTYVVQAVLVLYTAEIIAAGGLSTTFVHRRFIGTLSPCHHNQARAARCLRATLRAWDPCDTKQRNETSVFDCPMKLAAYRIMSNPLQLQCQDIKTLRKKNCWG
jgi:hypothetical protein